MPIVWAIIKEAVRRIPFDKIWFFVRSIFVGTSTSVARVATTAVRAIQSPTGRVIYTTTVSGLGFAAVQQLLEALFEDPRAGMLVQDPAFDALAGPLFVYTGADALSERQQADLEGQIVQSFQRFMQTTLNEQEVSDLVAYMREKRSALIMASNLPYMLKNMETYLSYRVMDASDAQVAAQYIVPNYLILAKMAERIGIRVPYCSPGVGISAQMWDILDYCIAYDNAECFPTTDFVPSDDMITDIEKAAIELDGMISEFIEVEGGF